MGIASGVGSWDHLTVLLIEKAYGGTWTIVPFNSGGEAAAALLGGHIDTGIFGLAGAADPSKFKFLVHTGARQVPELPGVPSFSELGQSSLAISANSGAFVKIETDPAIVKTLQEAFMKAANEPGFKKWAKDTRTPIGEPFDAKAWEEFLLNSDQRITEILPIMEKSIKQMQGGK